MTVVLLAKHSLQWTIKYACLHVPPHLKFYDDHYMMIIIIKVDAVQMM